MNNTKLIEIYKLCEKLQHSLRDELQDKLTWQELAINGLTVSAILKYRDTVGGQKTLSESKRFVEKFLHYYKEKVWENRTKKNLQNSNDFV